MNRKHEATTHDHSHTHDHTRKCIREKWRNKYKRNMPPFFSLPKRLTNSLRSDRHGRNSIISSYQFSVLSFLFWHNREQSPIRTNSSVRHNLNALTFLEIRFNENPDCVGTIKFPVNTGISTSIFDCSRVHLFLRFTKMMKMKPICTGDTQLLVALHTLSVRIWFGMAPLTLTMWQRTWKCGKTFLIR